MPITYNNVPLNVPGAYTVVNTNGMNVGTGSTSDSIFLVGSSVGGPPNTLIQLTSPADALNTFLGGDLLDAYNYSTLGGAKSLYAWRVDPATSSVLTVYGANNAPSFTVQSTDYGNYTQQIAVGLSGTSGNWTATVVNGYLHQTQSHAHLGNALNIAYLGNGTAVGSVTDTLSAPTVTATSGTGGSLTAGTYQVILVAKNAASIAPSTGVSVTVPASGTIAATWSGITGAYAYDLYLSGTQGYSFIQTTAGKPSGTYTGTIAQTGTPTSLPAATSGAAFVGLVAGSSDGSQSVNFALTGTVSTLVSQVNQSLLWQAGAANTAAQSIPADLLDPTSNLPLTSTSTAFTANVGAITSWLNSTGWVTTQIPAGSLVAPAALPLTNLVGGQTGTAGATNWADAAQTWSQFQPMLRYVVACTDNPAFITPLANSVNTAPAQYPPVFGELFYGGGTTTTETSMVQLAAQFGSRRAMTPGMSFYGRNSAGTTTLLPAYILAALYAGLRVAIGAPYALTNRALPGVNALSLSLTSTQVGQLNSQGVAVPMVDPLGQIVISHGVTTSPQLNNLYETEESVGNAADTLRQFLLTSTVQAGGQIGSMNYGTTSVADTLSFIDGLLDQKEQSGLIANFTLEDHLDPINGNPTYELAQINVGIPIPTNGIVFQLNISTPVGA